MTDSELRALYPCPCCGFLVFPEPPGSYEICPVCNWEDDAVQLRFPGTPVGANRSLWTEQQIAIRRFPAEQREHRGYVRDPAWRPLRPEEAVDLPALHGEAGYWNVLCEDVQPAYYWTGDIE